MRCRHENADHLFASDWLVIDGNWNEQAKCEQLRCIDCGHWLSLGPSADDSEAVRIEIRAAELAPTLPDSFEETALEWAGRRHFIEGHEMPTSFGGLAGWLAAAINAREVP